VISWSPPRGPRFRPFSDSYVRAVVGRNVLRRMMGLAACQATQLWSPGVHARKQRTGQETAAEGSEVA
jgi:hypothetical protein